MPRRSSRGRVGRVALGEQDPARRPRGGRPPAPATDSRPIVDESSSSAARAPATSPTAMRDLDLGRQEAARAPAVAVVLRERGVDRRRGRLRPCPAPGGSARGPAAAMRPRAWASRRAASAPSKSPLQPADLAERVVAVGLRRRSRGRRSSSIVAVRSSVSARVPGAADGGDLGPVDPADAREPGRATDARSSARSPRSTRSRAGSR